MKTLSRLVLFAVVFAAAAALADDRVIVFRSAEDASSPPDPTVCARAPFTVNALLGAVLWSVNTRASDGEVKNDDVRAIGTATACVRLTNFAFPPGLDQNFYVEFNLPEGTVVANGTCKLISNNVPEAAIVLAGCNLKITSGPAGTVGGIATSNTVFNPFHKAGFNTGSYWTLLLYGDGARNDSHDERGLQLFDDRRSDAEVQAAQKAVAK